MVSRASLIASFLSSREVAERSRYFLGGTKDTLLRFGRSTCKEVGKWSLMFQFSSTPITVVDWDKSLDMTAKSKVLPDLCVALPGLTIVRPCSLTVRLKTMVLRSDGSLRLTLKSPASAIELKPDSTVKKESSI